MANLLGVKDEVQRDFVTVTSAAWHASYEMTRSDHEDRRNLDAVK
jgi:hypothetical protein